MDVSSVIVITLGLLVGLREWLEASKAKRKEARSPGDELCRQLGVEIESLKTRVYRLEERYASEDTAEA